MKRNRTVTGRHIGWQTRDNLRVTIAAETMLVANSHDFPSEGDDCDVRLMVRAYELGWKRFILSIS